MEGSTLASKDCESVAIVSWLDYNAAKNLSISFHQGKINQDGGTIFPLLPLVESTHFVELFVFVSSMIP